MDEAAEKTPPIAKPKNRLMIILLMVNLAAVAGVAAYFIVFAGPGEDEASPDAKPAAVVSRAARMGPLVILNPIVANLSGNEDATYLKISMQFETSGEAAQAEVEAMLVPIRDAVLNHLSSQTPDELLRKGGRTDLQDRLVSLVNGVLEAERVRRVYFTEFVIQ